tara:strand:- start:921 stop:1136 length:216 start_codon:yes stop_codon:yes gene_type:complete
LPDANVPGKDSCRLNGLKRPGYNTNFKSFSLALMKFNFIEEIEEFGDEYHRYMESTPAWVPRFNYSEITSN